VVTLQLEVVQRLAAAPDTSAYGVLTVLAGLQFESAGWFKVPRDCFFPAPDVDSACITLVRRPQPWLPAELIPTFTQLVKTAFGQRRKMLRKLLRAQWPEAQLDAAMAATSIPATARAETVSIPTWAALARHLAG